MTTAYPGQAPALSVADKRCRRVTVPMARALPVPLLRWHRGAVFAVAGKLFGWSRFEHTAVVIRGGDFLFLPVAKQPMSQTGSGGMTHVSQKRKSTSTPLSVIINKNTGKCGSIFSKVQGWKTLPRELEGQAAPRFCFALRRRCSTDAAASIVRKVLQKEKGHGILVNLDKN